MKKLLFLILLLVLLVSCETTGVSRLKKTIQDEMFERDIRLLYDGESEYVHLLYYHPMCYFWAWQKDKGQHLMYSKFNNTYFYENKLDTPMLNISYKGYTVYDGNNDIRRDYTADDILAIFASESGESYFEIDSDYEPEITQVPIHVSEPIQILQPDPDSVYGGVVVAHYENFVLKWNGDPLNENGVFVVVSWAGSMAVGDNLSLNYRRADIVPDNGECVLDVRMFDDIPEGAVFYITIARANLVNLEDFKFSDTFSAPFTLAFLSDSQSGLMILTRRNMDEK